VGFNLDPPDSSLEPPVTTALLIRNPVARHALNDATLSRVIDVAVDAGWRIETVATDREGRATELARDAAARGVDVVVVHGGDGTLNEAVNGVAGTATAVAILRGGTANVWAKETRVPKDAVKAMHAIVAGERRRVDLGVANGRYFLLMCGVGLDAAIVSRVGARWKRRLGALAYIVAGAAAVLRTKAWPAEVTIDGAAEPSLYWLLAGNTRSYGGAVSITHRAVADDGVLDVVLMRRGGVLRVIADGVRVLLRRHERSSNVRYAQAHTLTIDAPGIPIQLDGEVCGETPLRIEVAPLALNVIVPAGWRSPLFAGTGSPQRREGREDPEE
jgi:YegS/Rv2252/BmrU family lipid kinase